MTPKITTLKPIVTEKSVKLARDENTYMFTVDKTATKDDIRAAVETEHSVTVENVTTLIRKGKIRSSYRKGKRPVAGRRSDFKLAYVTVKSGKTIKAFDDIIEGLQEEAA